MLIHVLFGQRKESYPGEYAPEALAVITEFDRAQNPAYMQDFYNKEAKEKHWESLKIVGIRISDGVLMGILRPVEKTLVLGEIQLPTV